MNTWIETTMDYVALRKAAREMFAELDPETLELWVEELESTIADQDTRRLDAIAQTLTVWARRQRALLARIDGGTKP